MARIGIAVMKFRSFLLIACMAVVPALAMFSHRIPRDWRLAAQRWARGEGFARVDGVPRREDRPGAEEAAPAEEPAIPLVEIAPPPRRPSTPAAAPAPALPVDPAPTSAAQADVALVRAEVERQLAALGAVAFECVWMPGSGLHRCSCRASADPSGQLQRVFQSSNADPAVALRNLVGQVQFWKHRLATRAASGARPADIRSERR